MNNSIIFATWIFVYAKFNSFVEFKWKNFPFKISCAISFKRYFPNLLLVFHHTRAKIENENWISTETIRKNQQDGSIWRTAITGAFDNFLIVFLLKRAPNAIHVIACSIEISSDISMDIKWKWFKKEEKRKFKNRSWTFFLLFIRLKWK